MALSSGEKITFCLIPGMQRYYATVQSIDTDTVALQLFADSPNALCRGQYVMITDAGEDVDYYNEIVSREGSVLRLKRIWTGKRGYFRVDDVFPVLCRKVTPDAPWSEARIYAGYGEEHSALDTADEAVSPRLWKMLTDINAKLGLVLERLNIESEGLTKAERIAVNISASGIRLGVKQILEMGDLAEVKMLLPANPAVGIVAHGKVVRVERSASGVMVVSLHFIDLTEEVRDAIIQYTMKRQRDIVRHHRDEDRCT